MKREEAIRLFEQKNQIEIQDYHSNRRECRSNNLYHDQYIGQDIFEDTIDFWLGNFEEKELLLQLLSNYIYVPQLAYGENLDNLLDLIIESCGGKNDILKDIYFITFPSSKGVKSGGDIIRSELPLGHLDEIDKKHLISDVEKNLTINKGAKDTLKKARYLVFIDDVVGSGKTAKKNILATLKSLGHREGRKVFLAIMYAEECAVAQLKTELQDYDIKIIVLNICKKCMTEGVVFSKEQLADKGKIIQRYEEEIAGEKVGMPDSAAMGFNNSQLLLSFYYNTPNNTLCMFWKPTKENYPPFLRTSFKRPRIDDLKKNRENRRNNAYEMAKEARNKRKRDDDIILHTQMP